MSWLSVIAFVSFFSPGARAPDRARCPVVAARPRLLEMAPVGMLLIGAVLLWVSVLGEDPAAKSVADRFAVYWNRTNPR